MIRRDKRVMKDGTVKTYIRVVEGYRPAPGKPPKQRTLKSFGYLEDQEDPEAFMREVEAFDADPANREQLGSLRMYSGSNRRLNYGYKYLESIYSLLDIGGFIETYTDEQKFRGGYCIDEIFKYLVLMRILSPCSKRASAQQQESFYGWELNLKLPEIYRALDHVAAFSDSLQEHLNGVVQKLVGRNLTYAFYDVTNYYFEIDFPDDPGQLRRRGVSKEHRVDPIVQMGLFLDSKGLPLAMSLFPGNTSDTLTLQPIMQKLKAAYGLGRLVVVADKGINSGSNIDYICQNGDGYVFSQVLRGTKGKRYRSHLEDESGYVWNQEGTSKYKLFNETYIGQDASGNKVERERRVLIYWSQAEARMAQKKREEKLMKAEVSLRNDAYGIKKGSQEYIREEVENPESGELEAAHKRVIRSVNLEKAEKDAFYDGYFCLVTSELDYDAARIREVYGGLWKIESSFSVLKSDLDARPVHVWTQEHIRAHFLICFVALLIVRLLQHALGDKTLSAQRIARAFNAATCKVKRGGIVELDDVGGRVAFEKKPNRKGELVETLRFIEEDEVARDFALIQEVFRTSLEQVEVKQERFNRILSDIALEL